jgi:hypothetical protein
MFQLDYTGLLAVVACTMCWSLAVVLFRVGSTGSVARFLSILLFIEGLTMVSTGYLDLFLTPATQELPWYATWLQIETVIHTFGDCAMVALYPPFLAVAIQTRLTRPFGSPRVRVVLALASAALFFAVLLSPIEYGGQLLYFLMCAVFGFALIASIHAWSVASGEGRTRARAFVMAFGIRDICWGFVYGSAILAIWNNTYLVVDPEAAGPAYIIYALGTLLAVPLIAYGILRAKLFDIDLRIRWTIKQSTLAGIFVALVYLISEGAESFLSAELGNVAGLIASAFVVFFLAPLQRFSERVASAAMPNTENTPEYIAYRKMQVYEAAIVEAQEEGGITEKERALLNRLRESLGISPSDAASLESGLLSSST